MAGYFPRENTLSLSLSLSPSLYLPHYVNRFHPIGGQQTNQELAGSRRRFTTPPEVAVQPIAAVEHLTSARHREKEQKKRVENARNSRSV